MRLQLLRTDYKGRGPWRIVAEALNAIGIVINEAIGENGIELSDRGGRLTISGDGGDGGGSDFPWDKLAFGYSLDGAKVTVYPGSIRMHGLRNYSLASSTEVTLSGSTEWVYAQVERGSSSGNASILHSATEPETTSTHLRIPLYKFTSETAGVYALARICNMGDLNLDTPLI